MASKGRPDQAAGLRALLSPTPCRSISLNGGRGGTGATTLAINLAAALAERQREVLLLDEFEGLSNSLHRLRRKEAWHFESVLRREVTLPDALVHTDAGFSILPVSARPTILANLNERELTWLAQEFENLVASTDFLLLDTRPTTLAGVPSLSLAADDVLIIVSHNAESITDAYATIKVLHNEYARREFRILVNRATSLEDATQLFDRIRSVAMQYLGTQIQLRLVGYVPEDEKLKRATRLGRTVIEAFPDAEASHAFRQLADAMLRWKRSSQSHETPGHFVYRLVESSRILTDRLQN
ncbi:MinD/ParA family ATP-binding protein [Silvimonas amylolytica]|uniref:Site-determining protein n=1 Tax=Silvimonas amylolytica TaxID=449663 RepID=A0ABQ2PIT3_9NEIS|nr:AAA family ATPase [Silvimonas amylolytica]GGP25246.1 site-determining protein [Silvimonas amylolytica]